MYMYDIDLYMRYTYILANLGDVSMSRLSRCASQDRPNSCNLNLYRNGADNASWMKHQRDATSLQHASVTFRFLSFTMCYALTCALLFGRSAGTAMTNRSSTRQVWHWKILFASPRQCSYFEQIKLWFRYWLVLWLRAVIDTTDPQRRKQQLHDIVDWLQFPLWFSVRFS